MSVEEHTHGAASIREVMVLLEGMRKEVVAEVEKLEARIDGRFATHLVDHQREQDKRNGYLRWAVTSLMTGIGVLVAIYASLRGG